MAILLGLVGGQLAGGGPQGPQVNIRLLFSHLKRGRLPLAPEVEGKALQVALTLEGVYAPKAQELQAGKRSLR